MTHLRRSVISATLAATLVVGGGSAAFADHGGGAKPTPERIEQICNNQERITKTLASRKAATQKRIANLTKAIERAKSKGHKHAAARLERALKRANAHLAHINTRIAKFAAFVDANCD